MFNSNDEEFLIEKAKIKIVGVGDFGAEMVNYAIANVLLNVEFAVVATKNETLLKSSASQRIKVTDSIDEEVKKIFSELVKDVDVLFIFTDLSDENISMQLAELAEKVLTVAVVPSANFDKEKIEKFQNLTDSLIVVENRNVDLMFKVARCISGLVDYEDGLVGLDYADIKSILTKSGRGYIACGKANGEKATDAMKIAINSMEEILQHSKRILLGIFGCREESSSPSNLSMKEVNEATTILQESAHPDAEIVWGVTADITSEDYVEVIIIASPEQ